MFHAIIKCDTQTLEALVLTFSNDNSGRSNSALLRCLDYLSRQRQDVYDMNFEEMNRLLKILHLFGITYRQITRLPELETSNAIQRALGFRLDESGLEATISGSSFLARTESISLLVIRKNDRNEIVVNSRQLGIQIAKLLGRRLVSVLSNHAVACFGAKSFGSLGVNIFGRAPAGMLMPSTSCEERRCPSLLQPAASASSASNPRPQPRGAI